MKKLKLWLLFISIFITLPLLAGCSLFEIDTDKILEEFKQSFDYNGTYVANIVYENLNEVTITPESIYNSIIYEIKENSTFNIIDGDEVVETYAIIPCVCGDIVFSDRPDISGYMSENGILTYTRIYEDKTIRIECKKSIVAPSSILGSYKYSSFKRNDETITTKPLNSNYPEGIDYQSLANKKFVIKENQMIEIYNSENLITTQKFYFTDTNLLISKNIRVTLQPNKILLTTKVNQNLSYSFIYSK